VAGALQQLETSGSDVDNDGVPDVEELRNMESPNAADTSLECLNEAPPEESGGCGVAVPRAQRVGSGASMLGAFLVALAAGSIVRRRARR
jgi:hypothetical protein